MSSTVKKARHRVIGAQYNQAAGFLTLSGVSKEAGSASAMPSSALVQTYYQRNRRINAVRSLSDQSSVPVRMTVAVRTHSRGLTRSSAG